MKAIIIGYGYMGQIRRKVIEDLRDDIELVAICDQFHGPGPVDGYAHFLGYEEAIAATQPDIVFVCTPNCFSPDICIYALEQGCHVFCEKPPGLSLADVLRVRDCEQARPGLKVMYGFNHRHHPAILEAKSIAGAGRMGRILWLRGLYGKSGGEGFEDSWRNDPQKSGGGILLDQGIHMLDLFRFFCGDFEEVHGFLSTTYWDVPVEDNAFVILRNKSGQSAQLHSSATLWKHTFRLDIGLEEGYLSAQGLLSQSGSYGRETLVIGRKGRGGDAAVGNPREEVVYFDQDLSWKLQVQDMVNCIANDLPVSDSSSLDALKVMEIIDTVYRREGRNYIDSSNFAEGGA